VFKDNAVTNGVAIVVITYNPDLAEFYVNLSSYISQVCKVFIVDNSTSEFARRALVELAMEDTRIELLQQTENVGIARAQNVGIIKATAAGFKFVLEMDQDSSLPAEYVSSIVTSFNELVTKGAQVAGVGPLAVNASTDHVYDGLSRGEGLKQVEYTLSSGFLISTDVFSVVGVKREELFIDFVDWEWCWRAAEKGYKSFVDSKLEIGHMLGEGHVKLLFWWVGKPSPIRHYYQYRNFIFLLRQAYVPAKWKLKYSLVFIVKLFVYIAFFDQKKLRLAYVLRGLKDACRGKMGPF